MSEILRLRDVSVKFGGIVAIENLTMEIPRGEIVGVIGPNGAGKTTLFNVITHVVQPATGTIEFDGEMLRARKPHVVARRGITRTFQNIRLFKSLTVRQHMLVMKPVSFRSWKFVLGLDRDPKIDEILSFTGLWDVRDRFADELPYGLQRRVEIARALTMSPKLLLLDEPVAGLNSSEADELAELITKLRDGGMTVLLIEHDMQFVMSLCQKLFVLNFGSLIASGTPTSVQSNPAVLEAYLGEEVNET